MFMEVFIVSASSLKRVDDATVSLGFLEKSAMSLLKVERWQHVLKKLKVR